jgi:hypothetical protein
MKEEENYYKAMDELHKQDSQLVRLLVADSHEWGKGHCHLMKDDATTICGRKLESTPGIVRNGARSLASCKTCIKIIDHELKPPTISASRAMDRIWKEQLFNCKVMGTMKEKGKFYGYLRGVMLINTLPNREDMFSLWEYQDQWTIWTIPDIALYRILSKELNGSASFHWRTGFIWPHKYWIGKKNAKWEVFEP